MMRFDWSALLRAGVQRLKLRPDEFWALTPAELMVMLGDGEDPAPMGRKALDALMAAFPDTPLSKGDNE